MSDMGTLSHSEATVSCISYYAEPDRQPIRSTIRTLNGRTNKFGWLQARIRTVVRSHMRSEGMSTFPKAFIDCLDYN
jgi:hypothetical protein